jgi:hypothetical protein
MRRLPKLQKLGLIVSVGLVGAAVVQELLKPPEEREWHGRIAGIIPYDFRPPSPERIRSTWWSPEDDRLLVPQVVGVGWTVNVGRVARLAGFA